MINQSFSDGILHCSEWFDTVMLDKSSPYMLAILVALTNMIHQMVFNKLGKIYRPRDTTQINFFKTFTIFAVQYMNTAIIFIVAYNSFLFSEYVIKKNRQSDYFAGPFDEFDERWFLVIGCPIGLTMIFQLFTPHLPLLFRYIMKKIHQYYDRGFTFNAR